MSFLGSPIAAGPVWSSVLTGIFSYQSHCFGVVVFILIIYFYHQYNLELTGGLLNYQCFDLWTTKISL